MGVARSGAAPAALAWGALTLLSASGPPLPPLALVGVGALALIVGVAAPRPLASRFLTIGALPLWLSAAGLVGEGSPSPLIQAVFAALCLVLLGLGLAQPEGRRLRLLLLAGGLVLGLRALLAPGAPAGIPIAGSLGLVVLAGGASLGLPSSAARPASLALLLAVGLRLLAMADLARPPTDTDDLHRARAAGLLAHHAAALASSPALGLEALRLDPTNHVLALALLEAPLDPETLLDAGWRPEGASLTAPHRRAIGLSLERRGRGGEALRLLWAGRSDPQVAWTFALLQRDQGHEPTVDAPRQAPADTPRLPGRLDLHWALLTEGARSFDLELDEPVQGIRVEGRAEPCQGPAELELRVGARIERLRLPEAVGTVQLDWPLAPGPQRLHLAFREDLVTEDCDRNLWVESITLR